jgi:hypothetical protein
MQYQGFSPLTESSKFLPSIAYEDGKSRESSRPSSGLASILADRIRPSIKKYGTGFEVFTTKQATSPRLLHEAFPNEKTIHVTPSSIEVRKNSNHQVRAGDSHKLSPLNQHLSFL